MNKLKGLDLKLFRKAVNDLRAVEARSGKFKAGDTAFGCRDKKVGVIHCFNKQGKEVCLWYSGVSKDVHKFNPPRDWPSFHKRDTEVVATKEALQ